LIPIEFRELVTISTAIVHGRVADVRAEWTDDRRNVETLVTIEAREYLKGDLGTSFTVRVPGGAVGRYRTVFIGAPEFLIDDEVVLFLKGGAIVGLNQGAFRVEADERSGRPVVVSPIVMNVSDGAMRVVRGDSSRHPIAIEVFRTRVRQVLAGAAR